MLILTLSRASVAIAAIAVLASSTASTPAQPPQPREPLEVFMRAPAKLAALKRAVEVMQGRSPSDPTSWFFQAAIHGVSDEEVALAAQRDPAVNKVDQKRFWNQ